MSFDMCQQSLALQVFLKVVQLLHCVCELRDESALEVYESEKNMLCQRFWRFRFAQILSCGLVNLY